MSEIKVANAPCSWGILEGAGIPGQPDWLQVLDEIVESGYAGTELGDWGFMPDDPVLVGRELRARGLAMIGAFVPVQLADPAGHEAALGTALRTARLLAGCVDERPLDGTPFVILADEPGADTTRTRFAGRIRPASGWDSEQWRFFADGVHRIATAIRDETDIRTVFHHHCASFVETPEEIDRLLALTEPRLVGLCLDLGHYIYGGGEALNGLKRFRERIWHVHFKDCDSQAMDNARRRGWDYVEAMHGGVFCGLGEGMIDFRPILNELTGTGYSGWIVVENEAPIGRMPPLDYAKQDRAYLHRLGI